MRLILIAVMVALFGFQSKAESPKRQASERESACITQTFDLDSQNTKEQLQQFLAAIKNGSWARLLATKQLREAEFTQKICQIRSMCFEHFTEDQRWMFIAGCTKRRLLDQLDMEP